MSLSATANSRQFLGRSSGLGARHHANSGVSFLRRKRTELVSRTLSASQACPEENVIRCFSTAFASSSSNVFRNMGSSNTNAVASCRKKGGAERDTVCFPQTRRSTKFPT